MVASRIRGPSPYILIFAVTSTLCLLVLLTSHRSIYSEDIRTNQPIKSLSYYEISTTSADSGDPDFGDQYDPKMIEYIRAKHLTPPTTLPYNISTYNRKHIDSFTAMIMDLTSANGVFIEAGAYDGVAASNTLKLELLGWKGLLVECNPQLIPKLREKNRKAWISDVCLSTTDRSDSVKFFSAPEWPASAQIGRQLSMTEMKDHGIDWIKNKTWEEYERPSFPLYSIIAATGEFTQIDFFSLDVQGAEIGILKNYPFEKIPIRVIFVEINMYPLDVRADLKSFLATKGYRLLLDMKSDYLFALN